MFEVAVTGSGGTTICRRRGDLDATVSGFGRHSPRRLRWPVELKEFLDAKSTTVASTWSAMTYSVADRPGPSHRLWMLASGWPYERWR
jgi:hypothetical protein